MNKIAIFPGSFDPITNGHVDIIKRSLPLFDKVIVAIGINSQKKYLFALEDRKSWIQEVFKDEAKVEIDSYTGLTINYCRKVHANYIIRGIRSALDFEYEHLDIWRLNASHSAGSWFLSSHFWFLVKVFRLIFIGEISKSNLKTIDTES